jgi:hypothetical protein
MNFASMRSAIVIASVIVGSVIPSQTFAQTTTVFIGGEAGATQPTNATSTFRFTDSMILNSIGFYTTNNTAYTNWSYSLKGQTYVYGTDFSLGDLSDVVESNGNGIRWLNITPQSMVNNDIVTVHSEVVAFGATMRPGVNVNYDGYVWGNDTPRFDWTNSNLRVSPSNPGSNVAPEPGSFALALTGGAALIGICIRRRRNAG